MPMKSLLGPESQWYFYKKAYLPIDICPLFMLLLLLPCDALVRRGVEQLVARRAHNPEVGGSSPPPATIFISALPALHGGVAQLARAFGSYPECHVFESHRRYHNKKSRNRDFFHFIIRNSLENCPHSWPGQRPANSLCRAETGLRAEIDGKSTIHVPALQVQQPANRSNQCPPRFAAGVGKAAASPCGGPAKSPALTKAAPKKGPAP